MDCRGQSRAATRPAPQGRSSPISRTTSSQAAYRLRRLFYTLYQKAPRAHSAAPPSKTASPRSCRASSTTSARPCADAGFALEKTRRGLRIVRDDFLFKNIAHSLRRSSNQNERSHSRSMPCRQLRHFAVRPLFCFTPLSLFSRENVRSAGLCHE